MKFKNKSGANIGMIVTAGSMIIGNVLKGKEIDIFGVIVAAWAGSVAGEIIQTGIEESIEGLEQ